MGFFENSNFGYYQLYAVRKMIIRISQLNTDSKVLTITREVTYLFFLNLHTCSILYYPGIYATSNTSLHERRSALSVITIISNFIITITIIFIESKQLHNKN
jgi:hypothetical protein